MSERSAHQLSTLTAIAAFAAYFTALDRHWPLASRGEALRVGGVWLALTVAFEFGFGRLVAKQSWSDLLADYDLPAGRTWPLVLAWVGVGPAVVRERCNGRARQRRRQRPAHVQRNRADRVARAGRRCAQRVSSRLSH